MFETFGSFGIDFINRFSQQLSTLSKILSHYKTGLKHAVAVTLRKSYFLVYCSLKLYCSQVRRSCVKMA